MSRCFANLAGPICLILLAAATAAAGPALEAVTFAAAPGLLYVPLDEAVRELHWEVRRNEAGRCIQFHDTTVAPGTFRSLIDGTELAATDDLRKAGAEITGAPTDGQITVRAGSHEFALITSPKRVEVSLANQQLRGWQGSRLVMQSHVSSGRHNGTPKGTFSAGPYRARMHYSTLFHHAPMPWSVQINGHIFIHGFTSVPDHPASHGCIRLPLDGRNPAKFFYEWIDDGSPVQVVP